jgi:hypothetical protein
MSIHTICVRGSRRVVLRPSRNAVGAVELVILGADRQSIASVNIDVVDVGVLSSALGIVAAEAESDAAIVRGFACLDTVGGE